jgi:hypothetical protein
VQSAVYLDSRRYLLRFVFVFRLAFLGCGDGVLNPWFIEKQGPHLPWLQHQSHLVSPQIRLSHHIFEVYVNPPRLPVNSDLKPSFSSDCRFDSPFYRPKTTCAAWRTERRPFPAARSSFGFTSTRTHPLSERTTWSAPSAVSNTTVEITNLYR